MSTDETSLNRRQPTSRCRPLNEFWCSEHRGLTTTQTQQTDKLTWCPHRDDQQCPCQGQWDHLVCSPVCARLCGSWMVADDNDADAFFSCHLSVRDYGRDKADRADRAPSCQGHTRKHIHTGPVREGCMPGSGLTYNTHKHTNIYHIMHKKNTYYPISLTIWSKTHPRDAVQHVWWCFRADMIPHIKYLEKKEKSCIFTDSSSSQGCGLGPGAWPRAQHSPTYAASCTTAVHGKTTSQYRAQTSN